MGTQLAYTNLAHKTAAMSGIRMLNEIYEHISLVRHRKVFGLRR